MDGEVRGYKVSIPDSNDPNRVLEIPDGVYSMLENHSTDYTVMANANAETKISGKLPRKEAFKKRKAGVIELKDLGTPVIELTAKIDERDFSEALKYKIEVVSLEEGVNAKEILDNLSTENKYERIMALTEAQALDVKLPNGTKVMITDASGMDNTFKLKIVKDGILTDSDEAGHFIIEKDEKLIAIHFTSQYEVEVIEEGKTIIGTNYEIANIYKATEEGALEPVCALSQVSLLDAEEDYTVCFVERVGNEVAVKIFSTETQWMSYDELAQKLNEDEIFSELFVAVAITPDVEVATLLNKPSRRVADVDVKYYGFEVPNAFLVGYGLDYDERYRNLPYIGVLKPEIYEK